MSLYERLEETEDEGEEIVLVVRGDNSLREMLEYIRDTAGIGHSFEVVVDPDDSHYRKRFDVDGDGSFRLEIK